METLLKDLRYGFRSLLKRPGFTLIALIALALGIGANSAIFSIVNAVLLKPLPFPEPDQLVWVWGNIRNAGNRASVSPLDFLDFRSQNKSFEQFAASSTQPLALNLTGSGDPERLSASGVTGNYFQTLRVQPSLGRGFTLENERPGQDQVAILSYALWQSRFAGDASIVNKSIVLDGKSYQLIGVMPKNFTFPHNADLWVPMNFDDPDMKMRKAHFLRPIGRLKPGFTLSDAQADTDSISMALENTYPDSNTGWSLRLVSLREQLVGNTRSTLFILFGAVGFVLLIACANVANLMLVRAAARQKEIALRAALGASRIRLIRQLLTESVLLAVIGGALGILIALFSIDLLLKLGEGSIPRTAEVKIDATVMMFTLLVSLGTGLLFGLAPAFRTLRLSLTDSLKEAGRTGVGQLRSRTRSVLVVFECAVAVVLLIGAGLLIRSLVELLKTNPGFETDGVLTMRLDLSRKKYDTPEKAARFFAGLESRVAGLPGVEAVGLVTELPLTGQLNDMPFTVEGRPPVSIDQAFGADFRRVNRDYFKALQIPLLRGRNFTEQEVEQGSKVLVVSEQLVAAVFPNEDPIGKRLQFVMGPALWEIIGVVGDIRERSLNTPPFAAMYLPTRQVGRSNLVVRVQGDPLNLVGAIRREVHAIDPEQPVAAVRTMNDWIDRSVATPRYNTLLLGLFAVVALLLATTGIYGVMSYVVGQRTHEIGIRMALGARRWNVLGLVLRQGMVLVLIGVVLGLFGAFAVTRVMSSLLFGVTAKDPFTFAVVAVLLAVVAFVACYLPARRATKVDPLVALRYE
jgi:putative ABC transport system permease protein